MIMDKKVLRKEVRARIAAIADELKQQKSTMLALALVVHPAVRSARVVALFSPLDDEPSIGEVISVLSQEHIVVLPRVEGEKMEFYPFAEAAMHKGAYGIMEPGEGVPVAAADIDVMIVPGVAFTADGVRMGRGKGYYDKYMSQAGFKARTIAVCYAEQLLPSLPCEPHDVRVDEVLSR